MDGELPNERHDDAPLPEAARAMMNGAAEPAATAPVVNVILIDTLEQLLAAAKEGKIVWLVGCGMDGVGRRVVFHTPNLLASPTSYFAELGMLEETVIDHRRRLEAAKRQAAGL